MDKRKFKKASGEVVEYPVSEAYIVIEDKGVTSLVVIGPNELPPLLGVTTLELLGLQVDPVTGKLKPLELMLLSLTRISMNPWKSARLGAER